MSCHRLIACALALVLSAPALAQSTDVARKVVGNRTNENVPEMKAVFDRISPLRNAAKIRAPLFVAQGRNDPRVPCTEAEQIVQAVRGNGEPVWFLMFDDEGHGFRKKSNADLFDAASILFWQEHLLAP